MVPLLGSVSLSLIFGAPSCRLWSLESAICGCDIKGVLPLCLDRLDQRLHAHDIDHPFHIVGQHMVVHCDFLAQLGQLDDQYL